MAKFMSFTQFQGVLLYRNSNMFTYLFLRYKQTESQVLRRQRRLPEACRHTEANGKKELEV